VGGRPYAPFFISRDNRLGKVMVAGAIFSGNETEVRLIGLNGIYKIPQIEG